VVKEVGERLSLLLSCVQGTNSDCGKAPSLLTRLCLILPKLYWSDPHLSDSAFKVLWLISRPKLDCISRANSAEGGYVEPITPVHWAGKSGRAHGVRWWCSTVENAPWGFCARMIRSALAISRQGSGGADRPDRGRILVLIRISDRLHLLFTLLSSLLKMQWSKFDRSISVPFACRVDSFFASSGYVGLPGVEGHRLGS